MCVDGLQFHIHAPLIIKEISRTFIYRFAFFDEKVINFATGVYIYKVYTEMLCKYNMLVINILKIEGGIL